MVSFFSGLASFTTHNTFGTTVVYINTSFLCIARSYPIAWVYHTSFTQSLLDEFFCTFCLLWEKLIETFLYRYFCGQRTKKGYFGHALLLDIYPRVALLCLSSKFAKKKKYTHTHPNQKSAEKVTISLISVLGKVRTQPRIAWWHYFSN